MKSVIVSVLLVVGLGLSARPSDADPWDVYVSSTGADNTACLRAAPCATFAFAFAQLSGNGVIHVVDQGSYGTVRITHGVTFDGGGIASQLAFGGTGLPIGPVFQVAAGASDVVTIENFTMSGNNETSSLVSQSAIAVTSVGALHVEHCTFVGFNNAAIDFRATEALLDMKDVTIADIPNGNGVYVSNARASLEHVSISRTRTAVLSAGSSTVNVSHSSFNGNSEALAAAYGPTAEIHVDDCTITNNNWAVVASQGATAYVSRSTLTNNFIAALLTDGSSFLVSYGNNQFASNASDGLFTSTTSVK
jgi:hypothetical protein